MIFKKSRKILVGLTIIFVSVFGGYFLFFFKSKETVSFPNSKSKLIIKKLSLLQQIFNQEKNNNGKLIIKENPKDINILIKKVNSISPLVFDNNFSLSFIGEREINLINGLYWLSASKLNYKHFATIFEIKALRESEFRIILDPLEEDQIEGGAEDRDLEKMRQEVENYYRKFPLARFLPYKTDHFKIYMPDDEGVYQVELYPTANFLLEKELYKKQIMDYKNEVNNWIKSKGEDPYQLKLKFWPE